MSHRRRDAALRGVVGEPAGVLPQDAGDLGLHPELGVPSRGVVRTARPRPPRQRQPARDSGGSLGPAPRPATIVARSSVRAISLPPAPSVPTSTAGTSLSRTRASGRVGSMVGIAVTVSPGAAASTANSDGPAVLRATTSRTSAVSACGTKYFSPSRSHCEPSRLARVRTRAGSHDPDASAAARVADRAPASILDRYSAPASWSPDGGQRVRGQSARREARRRGEVEARRSGAVLQGRRPDGGQQQLLVRPADEPGRADQGVGERVARRVAGVRDHPRAQHGGQEARRGVEGAATNEPMDVATGVELADRSERGQEPRQIAPERAVVPGPGGAHDRREVLGREARLEGSQLFVVPSSGLRSSASPGSACTGTSEISFTV